MKQNNGSTRGCRFSTAYFTIKTKHYLGVVRQKIFKNNFRYILDLPWLRFKVVFGENGLIGPLNVTSCSAGVAKQGEV